MTRLSLWFGVFTLLFAASSQATAQQRDITLEETITFQRVTQAVTSSDGNYTAFTRFRARTPYQDDDGASYSELFVRNAAGEEIPFVTGDVRIGQIAFSADNKFIYYLANRADAKHQSLYRVPVNGGESTLFFQHDTALSGFSESSDGRWIAFTAREKGPEKAEELAKKGFRAQVYEEQSLKTQVWLLDTQNRDEAAVLVDINEHVHSVQFRPGHEQLLLRVAPTTLVDDDLMLSSYAIFKADGEEVVRFSTNGKLGRAAFSADGSQIAIIGGEDQHDPATGRLFIGDLNDGSVRDLVPNFLGHVQDIMWRSNNELVWLADINVETEVRATQLRNNRTRTLIEQGQGIISRITSITNDGALTLIGHSPAHPPEAFKYADNSLTRLTDSNPWLADVRQPRQVVINHEARDGLELQGILVYPHDYQEGQQVPVIMNIHGGPEAHIRNGWNDRYSSPTWFAAQQGFATFFPNYRGSTGRGVEFSKLGQNDYAGKEFDDIVDAKEHLVTIGLADPDRVGITGGSYGGYASAWGATKQTEHFAASVMFVGISNNLSKFGTTDIPNEMHLVHARSYPWDKWQWYLERSPIYWAEQARTPILIMHGAEDTRVHPSQSMELYRYLKVHGNVPVRLVLYPGEGHGNSRAASQMDYALRLMRWMNFYLVEQNEGIPEHELAHAEHL
ncbi:S9 family peptidase [Aliidiomarina sp.]|uniref:S9 family peptidase n=1 Tax=Aliidiomarina sp. TaxID=1872439 RepID=UPI003A4DD3AC